LAFLATACLIAEEQKTGQWAIVAFAAIGLMLLSGERKGWVAFAAGVAFVYGVVRRAGFLKAFLRGRLKLQGVLFLVTVVSGLLLVGVQSQYVVEQLQTLSSAWTNLTAPGGIRFGEGVTGSNRVRLFLLDFSIETVKEHPWWGIGPGEFKEVIQFAVPSETYVKGAHSEYQRYAVETGLTGLGLYIITWALMIYRGWRVVRRTDLARQTETALVVGLSVYGAAINLFLGGGALNILFLVFPAGLLQGVLNEEKQRTSRRASGRDASAPGVNVPA
jgi:O-antigen ligase